MAEYLALPNSENEVLGSNPIGTRIQLMTVKHLIAQGLSLSPSYFLDMTQVMLKGM